MPIEKIAEVEIPDVEFADLGEIGDIPTDSPFNYSPTGKIQDDYPIEKSAALKGFRERDKVEQARRKLATDSEFWACIVFQSREQKDEFLRQMDWMKFGDKYIDGKKVAKQEGITIPADEPSYQGEKCNRRLTQEVGIIEERK